MTTRAKFRVDSIQRTIRHNRAAGDGGELWTVTLSPVYSADPQSENKKFWDASPSGQITLGCTNPHEATFPLGGEVYVDFTPAA